MFWAWVSFVEQRVLYRYYMYRIEGNIIILAICHSVVREKNVFLLDGDGYKPCSAIMCCFVVGFFLLRYRYFVCEIMWDIAVEF